MAGLIDQLTGPLFLVDSDPDEFTRLVAEELGDHAGPADGFDALLLEAASAFDAASSASNAFDGDEQDSFAVLPGFSVNEELPLAGDLGDAITQGDAVLGQFDTDLLPGPPPPTPPPVPQDLLGGGNEGPLRCDGGVCFL